MNARFRAELVERTHDDAGLALAPGHMVVRMTVNGSEPFDLPMGFAKDLALLIYRWDDDRSRDEVFNIEAADRIRAAIRAKTGQVVLQLLAHYSVERMGTELLIRVKLPEER